MILQHLKKLKSKKIILASSSPRRKEILEKLELGVTVVPSVFEENLDPASFTHPSQFVVATAQGKAREVAHRLAACSPSQPPDLVVGADTCVCLEGQVYGKPRDSQHAATILQQLSGRSHEVLTGVSVWVWQGGGWHDTSFCETTTVQFATLSPPVITAYVDTGEPLDKAGGYGIQGLGGTLVEGIKGDYYNVMGFPLHHFCKHLAAILDQELQ